VCQQESYRYFVTGAEESIERGEFFFFFFKTKIQNEGGFALLHLNGRGWHKLFFSVAIFVFFASGVFQNSSRIIILFNSVSLSLLSCLPILKNDRYAEKCQQ